MLKSFLELYTGFKSLLIGLRITIGQFFKPIVTVQYPHETLKMPARFRGHIELVRDPATGKALCFACKLCERACPSDCITVDGLKPEGAKRKTVTHYRLDFTKCSLCGSCVEACREGAIRFSHEYNLASTNKEDYIMDLFKRLQEEAAAAGTPVEVPVPPPTPIVPKVEALQSPSSKPMRASPADPINTPLQRDDTPGKKPGITANTAQP